MPFVGYTVASAQQLSGQLPPYSRLNEEIYRGDKHNESHPRLCKKPSAMDKPVSSTHRHQRPGRRHLATEITTMMLSKKSSLAGSTTKASEESKFDDTALLLNDGTVTPNSHPSNVRRPEAGTASRSTEEIKFKLSITERPKFPRPCFVKCFHKLKRRVRFRQAVKLDPSYVDSLSSAFAEGVKALLLVQGDIMDNNRKYRFSSISEDIGRPFVDTCITDDNIAGQVVKLQSRNFTKGTASVQIGECEFFNLSPTYQTRPNLDALKTPAKSIKNQDPKRTLRIEAHQNGRLRFLLTLWGELYPLAESKCKLGWISNIEITDSIRKYAVAEHFAYIPGLVVRSASPAHRGNLNVEEKSSKLVSSSHSQGKNMASQNALTDRKDLTPSQSPVNNFSSPHQHKILTLISKLRECYASVLVFSSESGSSSNESFRLRFVSEDLFRHQEDLKHNISPMSEKALEELGAVLGGAEDTTTHILWGKEAKRMRLYCVPVMECRKGKRVTWPRWWVCFMVEASLECLWK